eukprot:2322345-Rhodomonas_salina.3
MSLLRSYDTQGRGHACCCQLWPRDASHKFRTHTFLWLLEGASFHIPCEQPVPSHPPVVTD